MTFPCNDAFVAASKAPACISDLSIRQVDKSRLYTPSQCQEALALVKHRVNTAPVFETRRSSSFFQNHTFAMLPKGLTQVASPDFIIITLF